MIFLFFYLALLAQQVDSTVVHFSKISPCAKLTQKELELESVRREVYNLCIRDLYELTREWKKSNASVPKVCEEQQTIKTEALVSDLKIYRIQCNIENGRATKEAAEQEMKLPNIYLQCFREGRRIPNTSGLPDRLIERNCRERLLIEEDWDPEVDRDEKHPSCAKKNKFKMDVETMKREFYEICRRGQHLHSNKWKMPDSYVSEICAEQSLIESQWRELDLKIATIECDIERGKATEKDLQMEKYIQSNYTACWRRALRRVSQNHTLTSRDIWISCREDMLTRNIRRQDQSCSEKIEKATKLVTMQKNLNEKCLHEQDVFGEISRTSLYDPEMCQQQSLIETEWQSFNLKNLEIQCDIKNRKATEDDLTREKELQQVYGQCWIEATNHQHLLNRAAEMKCRKRILSEKKSDHELEIEESKPCSKRIAKLLQYRKDQTKTYETCNFVYSLLTRHKCVEQNWETTKWIYAEFRHIDGECGVQFGDEAKAEIEKMGEETLLKTFDLYWMCMDDILKTESDWKACGREAAEHAGL